jgi:hypothetical protein
MADNIKIIGSINNIQRINRLKLEDLNLLNSQVKNQTFGFENDYIEYFIYDAGGNLINSNYNYRSFKLPSNSYLTPNVELPLIEIDPTSDLQTLGYISGQFKTQYNFQTRKISSPDAELFLNQISEDRTEIEIKSIIISSDDLIKYGTDLINELENSAEQKYYILNTTNNTQILVVNIAVNVENSSILFKLYEPLPQIVLTKEKCWVTEEIIEPYVFDINLDTSVIPADSLKLRGPNFGIELDIKQNLSTEYQNYSNLVSSLTGSSYQKVLNFMNDKSYDLNIDYTSFENFIHFSSAKTRLSNFYNKVKQIENYNNDINIITGSTNILKNEQTASIKLKIDNLIQNFDGFERYMYFESSSYAWPKSTNNKPYSLLSTGSNISKIWYNSYTGSAESYDINNLDYLYYSLPNYVKNDPNNYQQYYNFIDMIGHYFDNIWIYISSINDLYNADNNLEKGISKDIVYDQLKSLGINLYNSKGDDDFDYYINGLNEGSTLFIDDFSITSSYLNNLSKKDLLAETYKRIYHNIPLLTKTKGTSTGLKNLINTFGITGSILSPKEFGGSTKKNEIKGYDNDKITIKNNTITGNVLSPFISLQNNPTSSIEFTSTDLHFIDLSFSPQNELNTRVSSSIAFLNPTFSLDEYIGDPRLIESASYDELINQNNYFISASSAISGSTQRLDYKGFIELVKYFDNSLFKMLKDFVPARTNALTGITIKSPILERNKIKSYKPKLTEETVYDAEYTAPVISEDRDYHYDKIEGNKSSFYTGEFTGSYANINDIFENSNPNNYLHPTSSININQFEHTDFNVTLNNVSSSVLSNNKFKLENIYTNTNTNIFKTLNQYSSSAELQDSYESLLGHSNSRYNGTKLTSLTYNTYSSSSYTGSNGIDIQNGDISFGKSPVINHNTRKIGLFTQIKQNNILEYPKKGNVYLKYLVDENGNLTELNKKNKHWNEVQNIFKLGKTSTISQFDSQKFQNQNLIDGVKSIYNSGYYYAPILYASNTDDRLYFDYTGTSTSKQFKINLVGGFISGSTPGSETYPINQGKIYKLFNKSSDDSGPDNVDSLYNDGNAFYQNNGLNTFSTYSVQETGNQKFVSAFNIKVDFPNIDLSGSFTFNINKVGGTTLATQTLSAASGYTSTLYTSLNFAKKIGTPLTLSSDLKVYDGSGTYIETINSGTTLYQIYAGAYADGSCNIYGGGTYYVTNTYYSSISSLYNSCIDVYTLPSANKKLYSTPSNNLTDYLYFNLDTGYQTLTLNDKIGFEFITGSGGFNTTNFTASVYAYDSNTNIGTLYNQIQTTQVGNNPYVDRTSPAAQFISGSINKNTLILSTGLSYFENYQFIPSGSGISPANSKYSTYNSVVNPFSPKTGDYISIYYGTNSYFESNILNVIKDISGSINLVLSDELPSALNKPAYISSDITTFVISSQTKDENNIIINFGKDINYPTSLGFVIPEDIHPDVLNNIDTITKEVKQKLIDLGYQSGSL